MVEEYNINQNFLRDVFILTFELENWFMVTKYVHPSSTRNVWEKFKPGIRESKFAMDN